MGYKPDGARRLRFILASDYRILYFHLSALNFEPSAYLLTCSPAPFPLPKPGVYAMNQKTNTGNPKPVQFVLLLAIALLTLIAPAAEALETYASTVPDESRVESLYGQDDGGAGALGTPDVTRETDPQEKAKKCTGWRTWDGHLVLGFGGITLMDGTGDDLTVYHVRTGNGDGSHPPPQLYVSSDGSFSTAGMAWTRIGQLSPAPTDEDAAIVRADTFDFSAAGVDDIRYIKIEKRATGKKTGKFIDAVKGHHSTATDPTNTVPDQPDLIYPEDGDNVDSLTPLLETGPFIDPDANDTHLATQWQISKDVYFESQMVLDFTSRSSLTSLSVPHLFLTNGELYYWRIRFLDQRLGESLWSKMPMFTVFAFVDIPDADGNGIPDTQEVDYTGGSPDIQDMDANGVVDDAEPDRIKCLQAEDGSAQIGVGVLASGPVAHAARWEAFDALAAEDLMPDEMPFGLVSFKIAVDHPGDTAEVFVYFSKSFPENVQWYHNNPMKAEWIISSETSVHFDEDGHWVAVQLTDGGLGDLDGVANGVILGRGGPGIQNELPPEVLNLTIEGTGADTSAAGGCFVGALW
jgi:hypothetical protein